MVINLGATVAKVNPSVGKPILE